MKRRLGERVRPVNPIRRNLHADGFPIERKESPVEIHVFPGGIMQFHIVAAVESTAGRLVRFDRKAQNPIRVARGYGRIFSKTNELDTLERHHGHGVLNRRAQRHGRFFRATTKTHGARIVHGASASAASAAQNQRTKGVNAARQCPKGSYFRHPCSITEKMNFRSSKSFSR